MISLAESVAMAMDGSDAAIVPFLPYILQDTWEIGTDPVIVAGLLRRRRKDSPQLRVLDLGCGKGAVSVKLAGEFGCRCLGIDALGEFVAEAERKAREFGVERLCRFEQGDMRRRIHELDRFDVIVLGAVGPVFGDYRATLGILASHLAAGGLIVIDDGWIEDDSPHVHPPVLKRGEMLRQINEAGMRIVDEAVFGREEIMEADGRIFRDLEKRCRELMERHPGQKELFASYIRQQIEENGWLENRITCAVFVIKKLENE